MCPRIGIVAFCCRPCPSRRTPVPQSSTIKVPLLARTSTQDVLPPKWFVPRPGVAIEPLVPQNLTIIGEEYSQHAGSAKGGPWAHRSSCNPGDRRAERAFHIMVAPETRSAYVVRTPPYPLRVFSSRRSRSHPRSRQAHARARDVGA